MGIVSKTVTVKCPNCEAKYVSIIIMDNVLTRSEVVTCPHCDVAFAIKCKVYYDVEVYSLKKVHGDCQ